MSEAQLHLACRAANDVGGLVRVLHVAELPRHLPLDVPLPASEQQRVDALLDRAEQIAARYNVPCHIGVDRARSVGEAIVANAEECKASTIFIGLRVRNRRGTSYLFTGSLRYA